MTNKELIKRILSLYEEYNGLDDSVEELPVLIQEFRKEAIQEYIKENLRYNNEQ